MSYQEDVRRSRREQRFGPNAKCQICGERDVLALVSAKLCYACRMEQDGERASERHHVGGRANSVFAVPMPANDHRILGDLQQSWPDNTVRNREDSPLLSAAACLRGWLDLLRLVIDRTVSWIPPFLEALDAWLGDRFGGQWWKDLQWES